ncbi:MAG TPA: hypothetical protein VI729_04490 [Anaerolineales bacterium]|nr:hypothetical protein [Anaerolineales bacterium]
MTTPRKLLLLLACLIALALLLLLIQDRPMSYDQVVAFARQTGYRPPTWWEFEHLDRGQFRRLLKDGHDYPWLFVRSD